MNRKENEENKGKRGKIERFVLPGDLLGVIEEFVPGDNCYVEDGKIYSNIAGYLLVDKAKHRANITPGNPRQKLPKVGDKIAGIITSTMRDSATIEFSMVNEENIGLPFTGLVHVSQISKKFVEDVFAAMRRGDIIRARIIDVKFLPFQLATNEGDLGVIRAHCTKCGEPLVKMERDLLECPACGLKEKRKLAKDYIQPRFSTKDKHHN
ncbi:MAG: exosome complex RNA-binding protein Csl4 [Candidatus Wukongarchaeota archaeon]|nr:exosome complex RNA-binding protein Csl4 [Candidatus Wukongarchaeota archaeon]